MSPAQGTENRSLPIPPLSSLERQLPNLNGIDLSLPVTEYEQRGFRAEGIGDTAEAERWYWVAIKVAGSRDDRNGIQRNLERLLYWATVQGKTQRQLELFTELVAIMENRGHEDDVAGALLGHACYQLRRGRPELAKLALDRAMGNWRWKNNWVAVASAHSTLGNNYLEMGNFAAALTAFEEARTLRETEPKWNPDHRGWHEPSVQERSFADFANFARALGHRELAERYYRDAIRLLQRLLPSASGNNISIFSNLIHRNLLAIADLHLEVGELAQSLALIEEAERFAGASRLPGAGPLAAQGPFGQWGGAEEKRGQILLRQGDYAGAETAFRNEIRRWEPEEVIGTRGVSRLKMELGQALSLQGKHDEALQVLGDVLRFVEGMKSPAYRLHVLLEYAPLAQRAARPAQAMALLDDARAAVESYGILVEKIHLLRRIGEGFEALGESAKAAEAYQAALTVFESLLPKILDPTEAARFTNAHTTGIHHALAAHLHRRGKNDDALIVLERGKGQVLAQNVARTYPDLSHLLTGEDAKRLREAHQALTEAGFQIRTTIVDDTVPGAHERALAQWPEANRRYLEVRNLMLARYPLYRRIQAPSPPTMPELQRLAQQHPDTLFIEWSVGEESTLCCTLSAETGVQIRTLPFGAAHWHQQVTAWRAAILAPSITGRQPEPRLATELGRALLPPLAPSVKRLVLVTDGPLQALPFAALRLADTRRLVERYALRQTFSLGALLWEPEKKRPARRSVCLVSAGSATDGKTRVLLRGATGAALQPLRFADREVEQIAQTLKAGKPFLGAAATESAIRVALTESRIIHLAAHGVLLPENSLYSWLLLAENRATEHDGRLEAREIAELRLSAELAVLSACETGLADSAGIQGMAWAFRAAGCPAIAATLWKVDDEATASLMVHFYQGLQKGLPKDVALQQAQLSLRRQRVSSWAGLTLFGSEAPLSL